MARSFRYIRLPFFLFLMLGAASSAYGIKFDFQTGNASDANSLSASDGGFSATASGWGGLLNPQNTFDPTNPSGSGAQNLGVNIGTALGFGRGIGCGTAVGITQCDLISPGGEDFLLVEFDTTLEISRIYGTLLEDPDDVSAWSWNGGVWDLIGTDPCPLPGIFNFCGSFSQYDGEDIGLVGGGTLLPSNPTSYLMLVAENSGASAFRLGFVEGTPIPEPSSGLLFALGLVGLAGRSLRMRASPLESIR